MGFDEKNQDIFAPSNTERRGHVTRSLVQWILMPFVLLAGCASPPWADEPSSSEPPPATVNVPQEDVEKVDELLKQRSAERDRLAEASRRREVALNELAQANDALIEWQKRSDDAEKDAAIRGWQVRIGQLQDEVRNQNVILGRDREDGLIRPTPPLPPTPPATPATPQ
jgi:hypothetical protein